LKRIGLRHLPWGRPVVVKRSKVMPKGEKKCKIL